jgi:hypothetical protein
MANIHALGACDSGFKSQCPDIGRVSYIGITLAFQANERGSTPLTRSELVFSL